MGKYEEALAGLNDAQRLAVTTTEGPVLVIAGPGTGKTQLLTTRIAHILATTDALPQNILCLTFTDSAAHTMRERLAGMIGQAAYDVTISTYHAFGSDLIRRFPDYFADQTALEPADDLTIDGILRSIIASLPFNNPLKFSDAYLGDIKTLISDAKRALLTPDALRTIANTNLEYIKAASLVVQKTLGVIPRLTKNDIPKFAALHQALGKPTTGAMPQTVPSIETLDTLFVAELETALSEVEETGKATPLTKWKNNWLAKNDAGEYVLDGARTCQKLLAAADVYAVYLLELKARGLFDYDDMILRAVETLQTNNDLRFTLQEQYLYMLLDEFQDTNGAQLKIVELLTDNPVLEGRPNVLAVGDDDQAIYAFQGASYSHMLHFKQMYRDVLAVPLTQNYRSHASILHTARGVAEQIEERLHHHFPEIEKNLTAENKTLPEAIIERREAQSDVMQFAWTANRIRQLIEDGMPPSEIAVVAPQHRFIEPLVPFLQQKNIPVRYDKRENILDDPGINQLIRMSELCLALAESKEKDADALWSEVLSFAFWKLPTSTIWRLSWQSSDDKTSWTETVMADEQLRPIALFFLRLSQLAVEETLETMLDYLIGSQALELNEPGLGTFTSPYYRHYFGEAAVMASTVPEDKTELQKNTEQSLVFWDLLTNLVVLRARLRDHKRGNDMPLKLEDFITFVTAHRDAELKILNTSPYASAAEAVQLMTAYKAKGMEFGAVFVLAVTDEAWGSRARGSGNRISLPPNLQHIRYAGATNDERLRLFYVALSRAKSQLYLMSYTHNYTGKAMTRLKYLDESLDERYTLQSPLLPENAQAVLPAEEQAIQPTTELAAYWQRRHQIALTANDMQAMIRERLKQFQLSPTHVNDFTDLMHCGPTAFFMRTILRFPEAPLPQIQFGNAIHETLEWIHISTKQHDGLIPGEQIVLKKFEERLLAKRLKAADGELYLERGKAALKAYLKQRLHTISPEHVVEHSFRSEGVFIGKAHMAGKIDKIIINRQNKTIAIVDYKTGKSFSRWSRDIKLHKYQRQLYLYKALVEASHSYAGYTVTDAYLEFVEPDEDGNINELHLTLTPEGYRQAKAMAEAVWKHIHDLSLPDTSGYTPDLSGIEKFETYLLEA